MNQGVAAILVAGDPHLAQLANSLSCSRRLNAQTVPDRYPIPHIQDFTQRLAGSKVFSKINLVWTYYQIPVEPSDVHKTVVTNSGCSISLGHRLA